MEFSRIDRTARAPRWPSRADAAKACRPWQLIEVESRESACRCPGFPSLSSPPPGLLLKQVGSIPLRFDRLLKDRLTPAVLFAHRLRGGSMSLKVWLYGGSMSDHGPRFRVNLEDCAAAGTSLTSKFVEVFFGISANDIANEQP